MTATSLDLSQIKTDALSAASTFRTLIGLGTGDTPTFKGATLSTGTITASTPAVDISQTWNSSGVTFTGSKINITDTASASGSLLADWQVNSSSVLKLTKSGGFQFVGSGDFNLDASAGSSSNVVVNISGKGSTGGVALNGSYIQLSPTNIEYFGGKLLLKNTVPLVWCVGQPSGTAANQDLQLSREAAGILSQRNLANAQTFRIYNTTDSGIANYERAKLAWESNTFVIGTEIAGSYVTPRNIAFTGGNVGIGTTSPDSPLVVYRASASPSWLKCISGQFWNEFGVSGGNGQFTSATVNGDAVFKYTGTNFYIVQGQDGENNRLAIRSSGNIGISTSSPAAKLDISDTTSAGSGSLAASTLNIATTWNTTGTPTLIKANVTDTASNAASLLLDLQVGGSSKFKIQKNGLVILSGNPFIGTSSTVGYGINGDGSPSVVVNGSERMSVSANRLFLSNDANFGIAFSAGAAYQNDTVILRDGAAHTLAMRYGNIAQTFRLYGTHTDSNNYRRLSLSGTTAGAFTINAEGAGTGASGNTLEFQIGGTGRLNYGITNANAWTVTTPNGSTVIGNYGAMTFSHGSSGNLVINPWSTATNNIYHDSGSLRISPYGNTTECSIDIKRLGSYSVQIASSQNALTLGRSAIVGDYAPGLFIVGANDASPSATTNISGGNTYIVGGSGASSSSGLASGGSVYLDGGQPYGTGSSGNVIIGATRGNLQITDARNVIVGTTTGTKIGTATTQKLGFYNATPVVQPTAVADATDAASVITQLNALLSRMRDLGLIAT